MDNHVALINRLRQFKINETKEVYHIGVPSTIMYIAS
jgi:hypothetical protein